MAKRNTFFEDEKVETKIDFKQLMRTLKYVLPYKKLLVFVSIMMIIASIVSLIPPILLQYIVDVVVVDKDIRTLVIVGATLVFLAVIEILSTFIQTRALGRMGFSIITKIRSDIFEHLQMLSFDYYDNRPDGKIVVRVTEYINNLAEFFTNYVLMFLIYILKLVIVTIFMLVLSPKLTLIVFCVIVPMMTIIFILKNVLQRMNTLQRAKNSNRTAFLVESIMGEQIVKNYNRVEKNEQIYKDIHEDAANYWFSITKRSKLNGPVVLGFWHFGTLLIYGMALSLILDGDAAITAGVIITFTSYMGYFQEPISQIATIVQELASVSSNLEQVFDTIDYPVDIKSHDGATVLTNVKGKVDFNDVTFAYDEENILEHFDLHVDPGMTIALVGPTGAGKTTVINMLTRFYDVKDGSVCIDGVNVKDATLLSLRKEVGVLMQDPFIFKGTVMDNIRYGRWDATDEECIAAAKVIKADRFIEKLSGGFFHELEERGAELSAGEKQLLSFVRIVLKNPSVIVLDEATSAIDTSTELLIQEALTTMLEGRTAFIVAHRLSTIKNADQILYISDKGIAEQGTHQELMAKKGRYYDLAR